MAKKLKKHLYRIKRKKYLITTGSSYIGGVVTDDETMACD